MRQIILVLLIGAVLAGILYGVSIVVYPELGVKEIVPAVIPHYNKKRRLDIYSIDNLKIRVFPKKILSFYRKNIETEKFISFYFSFDVEGKKVTGLSYIPKNIKNAYVLILFRGYVDPDIYESGIGTRHAAEIFARNGFITLAPDFLGFGESDMASSDPMEARFMRYVTGLQLIHSVDSLNTSLETLSVNTTAETSKLGIWGHSNGGHIALVMLEVTGKQYPTTLWAPVTKPFPYSILYYTDEYDDYGKELRKILAEFEREYNVDNYSLTTYLDWIQAPIQIHQGTNDDAVPKKWSDEFVSTMKEKNKDITYYTYQGEDHNFSKGSWNTVVSRDIQFFKKHLSE